MHFQRTAQLGLIALNLVAIRLDVNAIERSTEGNPPTLDSAYAEHSKEVLARFLGIGKTTQERIADFRAGKLQLDESLLKMADIILKRDCGLDLYKIQDPKHAYLIRTFALSVSSVEVNLRNKVDPNDTKMLGVFTMYLAIESVGEVEPKLYKRQELRETMALIYKKLTVAMREGYDPDIAGVMALNEIGYLSLGDQLITAVSLVAREGTFLNNLHQQERASAVTQGLFWGALIGAVTGLTTASRLRRKRSK